MSNVKVYIQPNLGTESQVSIRTAFIELSDDVTIIGTGVDKDDSISKQKAVSEMVERCSFPNITINNYNNVIAYCGAINDNQYIFQESKENQFIQDDIIFSSSCRGTLKEALLDSLIETSERVFVRNWAKTICSNEIENVIYEIDFLKDYKEFSELLNYKDKIYISFERDNLNFPSVILILQRNEEYLFASASSIKIDKAIQKASFDLIKMLIVMSKDISFNFWHQSLLLTKFIHDSKIYLYNKETIEKSNQNKICKVNFILKHNDLSSSLKLYPVAILLNEAKNIEQTLPLNLSKEEKKLVGYFS